MGNQLIRLKKRQEFVQVSEKGQKAVQPGLVLQSYNRKDDMPDVRVGFTATKKTGGAVQRNRIKRRLREIARIHLAPVAKPGYDYVLVGRAAAFSRPFDALIKDLTKALAELG